MTTTEAPANRYHAAAGVLFATRALLLERLLGTLGWCGYSPTHIVYRAESEVRVMRDEQTLAVVYTHWPALWPSSFWPAWFWPADAADDYSVRFSCVFTVPPLAPPRPAFLDDWQTVPLMSWSLRNPSKKVNGPVDL